MSETISLEVAIEMVLKDGPTFETIAGLCKMAVEADRERICKAIKEEDDYCVDNGDYMLDSDDCIAVASGKWKRPDFAVDDVRARGQS